MCGIDTLVDLMLLEMINRDVILGMDWLASCHATVDCHLKEVRSEVPRGLQCVYKGNTYITPVSLISSFNALRLISKGSQAYLAMVKDTKAEVPSLEQVPVVREFLDIFLEELPGMPPDREIEFQIDVFPNT